MSTEMRPSTPAPALKPWLAWGSIVVGVLGLIFDVAYLPLGIVLALVAVGMGVFVRRDPATRRLGTLVMALGIAGLVLGTVLSATLLSSSDGSSSPQPTPATMAS